MPTPKNATVDWPQVTLRPPEVVMRLKRMGSFFPTRLSFMRTLIRLISADGAHVRCSLWDMDDEGYGRAVYALELGGFTYSLVAFATPLPPERRTDRVIADAWDTSYVLFDGTPSAADLDRLAAQAPLQEAGRFTEQDLILSRANKSVRLFEHVVDCLARGEQPDAEQVRSIGYLMRTTAVYGNGKFGIADRARLAGRPLLNGPFRAEMLTVWLIRGFTHDLVEYIARRRGGPTAVPLARHLKRHLGIGNATGLGMAPFLVSHPKLLHNWMMARETALTRVRAIPAANDEQAIAFDQLLDRARRHLADWSVADPDHMQRIEDLRKDVTALLRQVGPAWLNEPYPFDGLVRASEQFSEDCQELFVALVLEPHGELVDPLEAEMSDNAPVVWNPAMRVYEVQKLIGAKWSFAKKIDFDAPEETAQFWYVSEEKLEPRLGRRREEPGAERELPLDVARQVQKLSHDLEGAAKEQVIAEFLMRHPQHREAVRRVQTAARYPYSEIQDNLISDQCLPIDMLRCKLAMFGASKFDPRSTLWTRVTLFQGAPLFDELAAGDADDWWLPVMGADH